LTPFLVETGDPAHNAVKAVLSHLLYFIIPGLFILKKAVTLDGTIKLNVYILIMLILFGLMSLSTILTYGQYSYDEIYYGGTSFSRAVLIMKISVTAFCCYQLLDLKGFLLLLKVFYYSFLFSLIGVFLEIYIFPTPLVFGQEVKRLTSFAYDPNVYGQYLSFIILLSYLFYLRAKPGQSLLKIKYGIIGISAFVVLLFTFSRGSFFMMFIYGVILFFLIKDKINRKFIMTLAVLAMFPVGYQMAVRMTAINMVANTNVSDYSRLSTNMATLNIIKHHFPFGVGFMNARYLIKKYYNKKYPLAGVVIATHNVYLIMLAELGFLGLLLYLLYNIFFFRDNYALIKRHLFPGNIIYLFNFCVLASYAFHALIYHQFFDRHIYFTLILICMLSLRYADNLDSALKDYVL
jgi:O-antigen ligase